MLINSGTSRSLVLSGNIHDLFLIREENNTDYIPLVPFLSRSWDIPGFILIVYELNGPIRFAQESEREKVKQAFNLWRGTAEADLDINATAGTSRSSPLGGASQGASFGSLDASTEAAHISFTQYMNDAIGSPTLALELLRQFCLLSRSTNAQGEKLLPEKLIILIEATDMLLPEGEIRSLSLPDRHRVSIVQDWISDSNFMNGNDTVIFIAESPSLVNSRIIRLPQVVTVEIPAPGMAERQHFIFWFNNTPKLIEKPLNLWGSQAQLAMLTAGLSLQALRQMLLSSCYSGEKLQPEDVIEKVSEFIQAQLGEDVVEFKKPAHNLKDIVGNQKLVDFLKTQLIPRITSTGPDAIPGMSVCGPIGSGKTFIFEGLAGELDIPVLVLKNIRSMWFGQTDVIFERLRRLLMALVKVLIFVDEADTQFGGVGRDAHSTERRLTGKVQAMMSDPQLRGNITWLLMTARIYNLSPDLRREGRVGDIVVPVLDPKGEDREAFLRWTISKTLPDSLSDDAVERLLKVTEDYSAASFASLRSDLEAASLLKKNSEATDKLTLDEIIAVAEDRILPNIGPIRQYQTLQALLNCTRKSLLPGDYSPEIRESWVKQIAQLEAIGVRG
ncbi:ATP-binding protein [Candidatus Poribacteria bacterium]|nr:ATP-binding protein [Candidatus Poribacteria bacterium]MYG06742.1 ATP-binding protein [Candidatus Poribacteria bacterium]MYK22043.1 ATP-binding protein [Candidatus Poribacteria bacterium]